MGKKVRILSIDGGGIRGIIPATVLEYVEKKLKEVSGDENACIADYFDLIAGTSTGGILTCFYLIPNPSKPKDTTVRVQNSKYSASKALEFYSEKGFSIFNQSKNKSWLGLKLLFNATRFNPTTIEGIFSEEFGNLMMSDLLKPCILTSYDMMGQTSVFFSSRETRKDREYFVRDVVRSTSAAPTYFPTAFITNQKTRQQMANLDGGVFANNPAMCAYVEARKTDFGKVKKPAAKDMIFLSIGTGGGRLKLPKISKSGKWGGLRWAMSIPNIMMDGAADTVDYQVRAIFDTLSEDEKKQYKRIDVPLDERHYAPDMSDASPDNIKALKAGGEAALSDAKMKKENELALDEFIQLLL